MKYRLFRIFLIGIVYSFLASEALAQDSFVAEARAYVAAISQPNPRWDGPTAGPIGQREKSIIYISADQRNGGASGVGKAVGEAAKVIGWKFLLIDGQGTAASRTAALTQAADMNPDGIILGTVDAKEQAAVIKKIAERNIKIVGWHALGRPGPAPKQGIFTNIATDPEEVAKGAAMFVVADADGKAGVVIFNDPIYEIGNAKADAMAGILRKCAGCEVLAIDSTHLSETAVRIPQRTALLLQRYGAKWTYSLGTNDLYFDFMPPSLLAAMIPGSGYPKNISAGDGSEPAFERIRQHHYQVGTVAEPLRLHGWQAIDELNRAFSGKNPSGYSTSVHLITAANIKFDGGDFNAFDPDNGYRDMYKKIWGVK